MTLKNTISCREKESGRKVCYDGRKQLVKLCAGFWKDFLKNFHKSSFHKTLIKYKVNSDGVFNIKLYCVSGTHMSALMGESEGICDKRLLIDFVRWTRTGSSSSCAQEQEGWASTSLLQILASYSTLTGIHRMICRSQFSIFISYTVSTHEVRRSCTVGSLEVFNLCNNRLFIK